MASLHDELDALFRGQAPPPDETGALAALLAEAAAAGAFAVFAAGNRGDVLAAAPARGDMLEAIHAAAAGLARLPPRRSSVTVPPTDARGPLTAVRVRAANPADGFIGILRRGQAADALCRFVRTARFRRLAQLAHAAALLLQDRNFQRTRARQLETEQDAVRVAHAETVTAVLLEREEHARARRRYIDELENEVQRRSAALREAVARAEQANESKSQFLANMSHEIRTPMTAILGFAESLAEAGLSDAERKSAIETIHRNGKHLLEIINDILDLSKIEAGRLDPECVECQLAPLVADVIHLMRVKADARTLPLESSFVGPCPATIQTDPTRLRQILINLIGNAIKFTTSGSVRVEIRYEPAPSSDPPANAQLVFDVIDTGIGIQPDQVARLFSPFSQADNSMTRRFGGTGLGLAISLRLARMLGGGIEVESRPGAGSRFRLRIAALAPGAVGDQPPPAAAERSVAANLQPRAPVPPLSLLLAEDGPDNQRLISFILRRAGHSVTIVEDGQAAVDAAQAATQAGTPFAVILMDMQMPRLDGYGATRALRAAGYGGAILALTAHAMNGDRERCLDAGCDEYASKPVDRAQLLKTIEQLAASPPRPHTPEEVQPGSA